MKKVVLVLVILAVVGGSAFAFDLFSFPDPIEEGDFLISPTIHLGSMIGLGSWGGVMLGITGALDYALPLPIPFMAGGEVGFAFFTSSYGPKLVPILGRFSWHPNFEVDGLDTYVRVKIGYAIGFGDSGYRNAGWSGGFAFGTTTGARYFFNDMIGVFGELGWDGYRVSYDYDYDYGYYWSSLFSFWVWNYLHVGVTIRIGG